MIKRKVRIFTRDDLFQDFLDTMDDGTTIAHYSVSKDGVHYIITETEVQQPETEIQKLEQLIKSTQYHFTDDLENCIDNMNFYYSQGNMNDYREYVKQYDGIMKRYGERLKDLHKRLDKLQK